MEMMKSLGLTILIAILLTGCAGMTMEQQRLLSGGAMGAAAGATVGAMSGGSVGTGAVVGGALGAAGGAVVNEMKK